MIILRSGDTAIIRNKTPEIKTMVSACCQVNPMPMHTVKVKKALRPIPGACANGTFAIKAVKSVPIAAPRHVATITALLSIPAWER